MNYKEKMIELLNRKELSKEEEEKLADIFPELKESEDERMWKLIKKYAHCNISDMVLEADHITREQLESWLEKQCGQKPIWTNNDRTMAFTLLRDIDQMTYISKEGKDERLAWLNSLEEKFISKQDDEIEPKFHEGDVVKYGDVFALVTNGRQAILSNCEQITIQYPDEWVKANSTERKHFFDVLEKQCEQKSKTLSLWKHWKDGIAGNGDGNFAFLIKNDDTYSLSSCLSYECDYIELDDLNKLLPNEKQGNTPEEITYVHEVETGNGNIKALVSGKVKLLKFKAGDWVVLSTSDGKKVVQIDSIEYFKSGEPRYITSEGRWFGNWTEAHLWTIQDAKDGDVLNSPSHRLIWIYEYGNNYHACVNMNYVTENVATNGLISIPNDACPATKDEQTILFARMQESGYKWDADKKEITKF